MDINNNDGEMFESEITDRGFELLSFKDVYNLGCSLQISSRAVCENEDGSVDNPLGWLWLGIDDAQPTIMVSDARELGLEIPEGLMNGWMPYKVPEEVLMHTRMHLGEKEVRGLVNKLTKWLETSELD